MDALWNNKGGKCCWQLWLCPKKPLLSHCCRLWWHYFWLHLFWLIGLRLRSKPHDALSGIGLCQGSYVYSPEKKWRRIDVTNVHTSILSFEGRRGDGPNPSWHWARGMDGWIDGWIDGWMDKQPFTPMDNLQSPVNPTWMNPTQTGRTGRKVPSRPSGSNMEPFVCEATMLTMVLLLSAWI